MSAADFLFTPSMQKVLGLTFANPNQSFTLNELLTHAGGGHGGGQRQIERLLAAGVLHEGPRRARQRSIQVSPHPAAASPCPTASLSHPCASTRP